MSTAASTRETRIEAAWAPLGLLRDLRDAARRSGRTSHDRAVGTLDSLVELLEAEVRDAFGSARPEDVESVATRLGERQWKLWGHGIELARDVAASIDAPSPRTFVEGWRLLAREPQRHLPALSPEARKYIRATAFLALETTGPNLAGPELAGLDIAQLFSIKAPPDVLKFFGLLQGVLVAGTSGAFGVEKDVAIARALWRAVRPLASPEQLEDAWDKAAMSEALLDEATPVAWEDVKASLA